MNRATAPLFNGAVLHIYNAKYEDNIDDPEKRLQDEVNSVKAVLSDEQLRLKRVSDLITAYEKIVEGNYIDNLIRVQRERDRTVDNANLIKVTSKNS